MKSLLFTTLLLCLLSNSVAKQPSDTFDPSFSNSETSVNWDASSDPEHIYTPNFGRDPKEGYDPRCDYDKYCPDFEDNTEVFLPRMNAL